ncbi:Carboxylesterase family-domain-containing protein [Aspergillus ambiguus]|uniref:putative cholinesterase n=1 Tax=Aspergillus ambiguus TaxID=176160 RepID=UPI003CCDE16D
MHIQPLLGALLLCGLAFAAPAPNSNCKTPHGGPQFNSTRATLQTLNYNNLGSANNGSAAVFVHDGLTHEDAEKQCASIGEELFSWNTAPQANQTELNYQFDYLVFRHELRVTDSIWVSKESWGNSSSKECLAYSVRSKRVVPVRCDMYLPALCTSSMPPTTDLDRTAHAGSKLTIPVDEYTITGYRDSRSFRFLGIPFADPPVNELRFAPPNPYSGPKDIDATKLPNSCIQSQSSFGTLGNGGISEDCLYLNVYTPIVPGGTHHGAKDRNTLRKKPVAVYFYGGAFTKGTSAMIDYDGGNLASRNDVIVVTVNYRVGALGWLATGNLTTGSYGTRDQIQALKWVNKHIAAFGGDPSHVTIFGQSAGGQSVIAMLSSSAARGLFSGAIVQSAPVDLPWFTRDVYANLVAPEISKAVGCDDSETETDLLKCLRAAPATSFLDNSTEFSDAIDASSKAVAEHYLHTKTLLASIEPLMPMVDDSNSGVIDDQFDVLLRTNRLPSRVPTMFTTVTDEAGLYVGRYVPDLGTTQVGLNLLFNIAYPSDLADQLIDSDAYPLNRSDPDGIRNTAIDVLTHSEWSCAQAHLLRLAANGSSFPAVYEVEITDGHVQTTIDVPEVCSPNDNNNATCHSADVLPIWGTLNSKTQNVAPYYDADDVRHSQLLDDVFGAFFRTRSPNPDPAFLRVRGPAYRSTYDVFVRDGYQMPRYRSAEKTLSLLGLAPSTIQNPGLSDKCRVFEDYGYTFENAKYTA